MKSKIKLIFKRTSYSLATLAAVIILLSLIITAGNWDPGFTGPEPRYTPYLYIDGHIYGRQTGGQIYSNACPDSFEFYGLTRGEALDELEENGEFCVTANYESMTPAETDGLAIYVSTDPRDDHKVYVFREPNPDGDPKDIVEKNAWWLLRKTDLTADDLRERAR